MIPISDNPPPGTVDRRDGSTKGEVGITTVNNLFCKDQISASKEYIKRYDEMTWAGKNGCPIATCPYWNTPLCWQRDTGSKENPKIKCPFYRNRQETGLWS